MATVTKNTFEHEMTAIGRKRSLVAIGSVMASFRRSVMPTRMAFAVCVLSLLAASYLHGNPPLPPGPEPEVPPVEIADFVAIEGITQWTFQGRVVGEDPLGLVVKFGGLLSGHSTTVTDEDGYFWYGIQLGGTGEATAQTTDRSGQLSNLATCFVY